MRLRFNAAMPRETVTVYFDYLCPFAWRGAELAARVAEPLRLRFEWVHFSLFQARAEGENGWQLWNDPVDPDDPGGSKGLYPFLASIAARRQGDELHDAFRITLMRLRHRDNRPFDRATIMQAAEAAGLHLACFERDLADPEARTALARDHARATGRMVTGTPTFQFPGGHTARVRLKGLPGDTDTSIRLFRDVYGMLSSHPYLHTIERPRSRGN